ncbi:MAG: metal ABC transporter solute-binding protein, Zn/Mn family [Desulfosudaceae bacterium]
MISGLLDIDSRAGRGSRIGPGRVLLAVFFMMLPAVGLAGPAAAKTIPVFVSIPPQKFMVERIGGDRLEVSVLVPPGQNPATFSLSPSTMAELSRARLFFRSGVPFEEIVLPKIKQSGKNPEVVDTLKGVPLRSVNRDKAALSSHDEDQGADPHTWLNPLLVKQQAETITEALCEVDPAGCQEYRANCRDLRQDLDDLHRRLTEVLEPVRGQTIFVFHPAFGYFADAYGLRQVAVEIEGKAPQGRKLVEFINLARENQVQVVFVQPQFDDKAARNIARAIDGVVVPLDPLAEDYITNMRDLAKKIRRALLSDKKGRDKWDNSSR